MSRKSPDATSVLVRGLPDGLVPYLNEEAARQGMTVESLCRRILGEYTPLAGNAPEELWTSFWRHISPAVNDLAVGLLAHERRMTMEFDSEQGRLLLSMKPLPAYESEEGNCPGAPSQAARR